MIQFGHKDWRKPHYDMIVQFMRYLGEHNNPKSGFVLKGGTALMLCYGLSRFSEDVDLDGYMAGIEELIPKFARQVGIHYRTAKDTNTVKRFMLQYPNPYRKENELKPLKVEISYRNYGQNISQLTQIVPVASIPTGVLTYNVQVQLSLKLQAFLGRDKIRDLYDVVFLGLNYMNQFDAMTQMALQNALAQRGLEHFDYMVKTQKDELIDPKVLESGYLELWQRLGLL